jgi:hypothetical protein
VDYFYHECTQTKLQLFQNGNTDVWGVRRSGDGRQLSDESRVVANTVALRYLLMDYSIWRNTPASLQCKLFQTLSALCMSGPTVRQMCELCSKPQQFALTHVNHQHAQYNVVACHNFGILHYLIGIASERVNSFL